uniref:Uncharacterized protein n=1 Tax=Plectus sambesii TaxID=2011161 RepID=A0A914WT22_9BILA
MDPYAYGKSNAVHQSYVRNSRAVGLLWVILSVCFAVINVLVVIQPHWLGSAGESQGRGYFGLYQYCIKASDATDFADVSADTAGCRSLMFNFNDIISTPFKIATIFIMVSAILILLSVACMLLFVLCSSKVVYCLCSWLQLFSFICMLTGCVVYPAGWDHEKVRAVCGSEADRYRMGSCELRWSYILALIGVFDVFFLCLLGFILACKQPSRVKTLPEYQWNRTHDHMAFSSYGNGPMMIPYNGEHLDESHYSKDDSTHNLQL